MVKLVAFSQDDGGPVFFGVIVCARKERVRNLLLAFLLAVLYRLSAVHVRAAPLVEKQSSGRTWAETENQKPDWRTIYYARRKTSLLVAGCSTRRSGGSRPPTIRDTAPHAYAFPSSLFFFSLPSAQTAPLLSFQALSLSFSYSLIKSLLACGLGQARS